MERTYATVHVGEKESVTKRITEQVIKDFADLSGDHNPLHLDEEFAKTSQFGQRIAHGMISAGLLSAAQTKYFGDGAVYVSQTMNFRRPVFLGDTLIAWTEVKEKINEKHRLVMKSWVENQNGDVVVDGEALLKFSR